MHPGTPGTPRWPPSQHSGDDAWPAPFSVDRARPLHTGVPWGGLCSLGTTGMSRPRGSRLGVCAVHCRMFSSTPGLHPPDTSSSCFSPAVTTRRSQGLPASPTVPGGQVWGLAASALDLFQDPTERSCGGSTCAMQPPGCPDRPALRAASPPAREDNGEHRRGVRPAATTKSRDHLCNLPLNTCSKTLELIQLFKCGAPYTEHADRASGCVPRD